MKSGSVSAASLAGLAAGRTCSQRSDRYVELLKEAGSAENLLENPQLCGPIPGLAALLKGAAARDSLANEIMDWRRAGIEAAGIGDETYPQMLQEIANPPPVIFFRGENSLVLRAKECLALVGSRRADPVACEVAKKMGSLIAAAGNCIVSGLALGVDTAAHTGAIESGCREATIAVLGSGLYNIYPASNQHLARKIVEHGGLVISQFEPAQKPFPSNFLNRNRLISGLSRGVLVVQASRKSGSLVTVRYALEQGREVMAVPGAIGDERYEGSNNLIKQGAYLVSETADVFEVLPCLKRNVLPEAQAASDENPGRGPPSQQRIIKALKRTQILHFDELSALAGAETGFASDLLELEFSGEVKRLPGNYIELVPKV